MTLEWLQFVKYSSITLKQSQQIDNEIKQIEKKIAEYNSIKCPHTRWEYRYQDTKNGRRYRIQCLKCGKSIGGQTWIKAEEIPEEDIKNIKQYQPSIIDEYKKELPEMYHKLSSLKGKKCQLKSSLWWESYKEYLQSSEWEKKRQMRLHMNKQILMGYCECCGERKAIMCHHLNYKNLTVELMTDLAAVCALCHEKIHDHLKGN